MATGVRISGGRTSTAVMAPFQKGIGMTVSVQASYPSKASTRRRGEQMALTGRAATGTIAGTFDRVRGFVADRGAAEMVSGLPREEIGGVDLGKRTSVVGFPPPVRAVLAMRASSRAA